MLLPQVKEVPSCEALYQQLKNHCLERTNSELICRMIASWHYGDGMLPSNLGLSPAAYQSLWEYYFPNLPAWPCEGRDIDRSRQYERDDLTALLMEHRANQDPSEQWITEILVAACMGMDHLWQDLGLWSRTDLSEMLNTNFPALAEKNINDMKWKKFLYKQLCDQKGVYVCRAPSCDVCDDYDLCFGPEE